MDKQVTELKSYAKIMYSTEVQVLLANLAYKFNILNDI